MAKKTVQLETYKDSPAVYPPSRALWRKWLAQHHDREKCAWLIIYHKGHELYSVGYDEAVEEALCFGWIDSLSHKRDTDSSYLYFTRRKPKGNWSKPNKERVSRMIAQGLMTPAGQAFIDLAKATGTWEALDAVDNELIPDDLQEAFNKHKKALKNFEGFPPSSRKLILQWIMSAKKPETRQKRIAETVALAEQNIRAHHPK